MDSLDVIKIAKQAGHAAIGVILEREEARIYAENLALRFGEISSSSFVIIFLGVYDGNTIA